MALLDKHEHVFDDIVIKTAAPRNSRPIDAQPSDIEEVFTYLDNLKAPIRKHKYIGLGN